MKCGVVVLLWAVVPAVLGFRVARNSTALGATNAVQSRQAPATTFPDYYNAHATGRGIWKWNNALAAYQRHFSVFAGLPVKFAEVGVQSGGSVEMWQAGLGPQCHVYGLDINPATNSFANAQTTITIGDQGDPNMWNTFFTATTPSLDILIDDGGHEPHQMLTTLAEVFYRLSPGGFVAIEDIHGQGYIQSFFTPAANYLAHQATQGDLDSVHVYPYLLIAQRSGSTPPLPHSELSFTGTTVTVDSFDALWAAVPQHPGGHIVLANAGWGSFFTPDGLTNFFTHFQDLHAYSFYDTPQGCATTPAAICKNTVNLSPTQAQITGIHIYPTHLVAEVPAAPVEISADRRGDVFLGYGF